MPLPPQIDATIRSRFAEILTHAQRMHNSDSMYMRVKTQLFSLMNFIAPNSDYLLKLREEINQWNSNADSYLLGYVKALKSDYEAGMFESLTDVIEANVVSDYMGQAELLLGEGIPGQYDHVPAAVLSGAVLEDALRRLCQRQNPSINTQKPNGENKTLDPLITDLQTANVFNKAKADQLRAWAKIRNYAAHGEFSEFNRADVDAMIPGIKTFIATYL